AFDRLEVASRHELAALTSRTSVQTSPSDECCGPTTRTKIATFVPASCCTTAVLSVVPSQSTMSNPFTVGSKFHVIVQGEVPCRKNTLAPLFEQTESFSTHSFGVAMMLKLATFLPTSTTPGGFAVAEPAPSTANAATTASATAVAKYLFLIATPFRGGSETRSSRFSSRY